MDCSNINFVDCLVYHFHLRGFTFNDNRLTFLIHNSYNYVLRGVKKKMMVILQEMEKESSFSCVRLSINKKGGGNILLFFDE